MANNCGLDTWLTNSECIQIISDNPFRFSAQNATVIIPAMCHNPRIIQLNSVYYLFYVGLPEPRLISNCTNGKTLGPVPDELNINPCFIQFRTSIDLKNWSRFNLVYSLLHLPVCPTNPTPIIRDNVIDVVYRGYTIYSGQVGEYLFYARNISGYYRDTTKFFQPWINSSLEDPFIFSFGQLYWIVANNKFNSPEQVGTFGISSEMGNFAFSNFYGLFLEGLNITAVRRERPFVLILSENNGILYNAVRLFESNDQVYIQAFPISFQSVKS
jgi:hypothetical protein